MPYNIDRGGVKNGLYLLVRENSISSIEQNLQKQWLDVSHEGQIGKIIDRVILRSYNKGNVTRPVR